MCDHITNEQLAILLANYPHTSAVHDEFLSDGSHVYVAEAVMLFGCERGQGITPEIAMQELREVKEEFFLDMMENGESLADFIPIVRQHA